MDALAAVGHAAGAVGFLVLALLLSRRRVPSRNGNLLLTAVLVESLCQAGLALGWLGEESVLIAFLEALRPVAWGVFIHALLSRPGATDPSVDASKSSNALAATGTSRAWLRVSLGVLVVASFAGVLLHGRTIEYAMVMFAASLVVLMLVERMWRGTRVDRRGRVRYLGLALTALFGFDLIMNSLVLAGGGASAGLVAARGYVAVLQVPLMAVAAARNPQWQLEIGVSRSAVFHSAALTIAGLYLFGLGAIGMYVRAFGGSIGEVASTVLFVAGLLALCVMLGSSSLRRRLRVWIAKHFFSYRYDYRAEWLKITQLVSGGSTAVSGGPELYERAVKAMVDTVGASGGSIWLREDDGALTCEYPSGPGSGSARILGDHPGLQRMASVRWIVDFSRAEGPKASAQRPTQQLDAGTETSTAEHSLQAYLQAPARWLVPLYIADDFLGFIAINESRGLPELDWETRDLFHAAAAHIAGYVAVRRTVEALVQAKQFDSFNRMSAFVVHDLKNLVAQLALLSRNADRHWNNPEFRDGALLTVRNVLERMQGLLMQLRSGSNPVRARRAIAVGTLIDAVVRTKGYLPVKLDLEANEQARQATVVADPEQLERVIGHVVQNAAEASSDQGAVKIEVGLEQQHALVRVIDHGVGMSADFIRKNLFKPFATTKSHGMGIGMFESRQYLTEIGGSIDVESRPEVGTTVTLRLPIRIAHGQ